jgi:hypothetical protein
MFLSLKTNAKFECDLGYFNNKTTEIVDILRQSIIDVD